MIENLMTLIADVTQSYHQVSVREKSHPGLFVISITDHRHLNSVHFSIPKNCNESHIILRLEQKMNELESMGNRGSNIDTLQT